MLQCLRHHRDALGADRAAVCFVDGKEDVAAGGTGVFGFLGQPVGYTFAAEGVVAWGEGDGGGEGVGADGAFGILRGGCWD